MTRIAITFATLALAALTFGCASGAGKEIARGAVRGAGHGSISKNVGSPVGAGAAHGALNSAGDVRDREIRKKQGTQ